MFGYGYESSRDALCEWYKWKRDISDTQTHKNVCTVGAFFLFVLWT